MELAITIIVCATIVFVVYTSIKNICKHDWKFQNRTNVQYYDERGDKRDTLVIDTYICTKCGKFYKDQND